MRPARSAWSWMTRRCSRGKSGGSSRSSSSSVSPAIEVSGLLSSCATPDTSWPIEAILSFWMSWASSVRCSVTSSTSITTGPGPARSANGAAASRSTRPVTSCRAVTGAVRSPRCTASISPATASEVPGSISQKLRPTSSDSGVSASAASARLARSTTWPGPTTAIPSASALKAVSHSSLLRRTISYRRPLASTTEALVATVESSQRSSVVNGPPWRSATASAPMVTPCERSGATAADRTISPPIRSTDGTATPCATSMRSRWMAKRTSAVSGSSLTCPISGSSEPEAPATRSRRAVLVVGQHDDRAVGLEEPARVLGDLVHDAVELDRFREDVAQLLEREQLADAAVELVRELLALELRLAQAPATARDGHPEAARDGGDGEQREPPDAVVGEPGDEPSRMAAMTWSGTSHSRRQMASSRISPAGDAEAEGDESRESAEQRAEQGAQHQRPGHEGRGRKEPAVAGAAHSHGSEGWLWDTRSAT